MKTKKLKLPLKLFPKDLIVLTELPTKHHVKVKSKKNKNKSQ